MTRPVRLLASFALLSACALPVSAQSAPPAKKAPAKTEATTMDHAKMDHGAMDHAKMHGGGGTAAWKELDAYHQLMMATWHPAKDRNDLAPIRGQAEAMVKAAELVGTSTPPGSCAKPELAAARTGLAGETRKVAALVKAKADDAALKTALSKLHDAFEVLEEGCSGEHR
jgi:hypothetical protein